MSERERVKSRSVEKKMANIHRDNEVVILASVAFIACACSELGCAIVVQVFFCFNGVLQAFKTPIVCKLRACSRDHCAIPLTRFVADDSVVVVLLRYSSLTP